MGTIRPVRRGKPARLRGAALAVAAGLAVWNCAPAGGNERNAGGTAGEAGERSCAAARHGWLAGRRIDEIDTAALPRPLRIHAAGGWITMDHRPERMNIVVGADGRVTIVKCG